MKNLSVWLFLIFLTTNLLAQDLLIKAEGDILKVKVEEITPELIKCKDFDFQDGPLVFISAKPDRNARINLKLEAEQTYYIRLGWMESFLFSRPGLVLVEPGFAKTDMQGMMNMGRY